MKALIFSILSALILSACGGSSGGTPTSSNTSYSGLTTAAVIDADNAEIIGTSSTEAIANILTGESVPFLPTSASITTIDSSMNQTVIDIAKSVANSTPYLNLPLAADVTISYTELASIDSTLAFCGGSATVDDALIASFTEFLNTGELIFNGRMTFIDLCVTDPVQGDLTLNGTVIFTTTAQSSSIKYSNMTVNDGSTIQSFNIEVTCSTLSCVVTTDYEGSDSNIYRIEGVSISDNGSGTYSISATFYHPDHGSVTIIGTDLTFNCASGFPGSGQITYSSTDGTSGTITFAGCNDYTGTWSATPPPAPTSGTYTGSWLN